MIHDSQQILPSVALPPSKPSRLGLSEMDRRVIRGTFHRLAQLVNTLPAHHVTDCMLLLTTCRNQWYTANALYAEARRWCMEGRESIGFGDALTSMGRVVMAMESPPYHDDSIARGTAQLLAVSAGYLEQFEYKCALFFDRFENTRQVLLTFADTITDFPARTEFKNAFANIGNGPGTPDDRFTGPNDPGNDAYIELLKEWFALARPLTSLARTYMSEVLLIGQANPQGTTCAEYVRQVQAASVAWNARGFHCPRCPAATVFEPLRTVKERDSQVAQIRAFLEFCRAFFKVAQDFLVEMLPVNKTASSTRFPLRRPSQEITVTIGSKTFRVEPNVFVLITDMRNSTGDKYHTPELKVKVEDIITKLRNEKQAVSQTVYDDSRVVACDSVAAIARCIRRLHHALLPEKKPDGFAGLRIGCTRGEMLYEFDGKQDWKELRQSVPIDSDNTMARAARLMSLDKVRFDDSQMGEGLRQALREWARDATLLFLDFRVFSELPAAVQTLCRDATTLDLKGVGKTQCWAIPIDQFNWDDSDNK